MLGQLRHAGQRAEVQAIGPQLDEAVVLLQAIDVDDPVRMEHIELQAIDKRRPAGQEGTCCVGGAGGAHGRGQILGAHVTER